MFAEKLLERRGLVVLRIAEIPFDHDALAFAVAIHPLAVAPELGVVGRQEQQPGVGMYTAGYYPHNYDFMAFAAMMIGRSEMALSASRNVTTSAVKGMSVGMWMAPLRTRIRRTAAMKSGGAGGVDKNP